MEIKVISNQNQIYEKVKLLGQGAFGKAYLVKHKPTGDNLVIKQMNIEHMSAKEKQETIKEAQILKNLNHPNIVNFKQVYITKNNKLKIVMEYAECGDLAKAIHARKAKKQYFQQSYILDWFTQICLAIKHVHDRKILHRDIKGQNIFIAKNNSLKLGDFGIARVLNKTMEKARTVVGTPYYLSPQIIENKPYSFQSDIWSIGAVLYQLCALQPPFTAASLQMLALKIVKGSYPPIQGNYSKQLKALIAEMLTLNPTKRPNINQILQKPVIKERIKSFLTQTKRLAEFSHTILHNQKVQIFANKLVQIKQQNDKAKSSSREKASANSIEQQRQKLKEQQAQMEARIQQKKRQQQRKRTQQIKRRQQIKRKQQQRRKQQEYRDIRRKQQEKIRQEQERKKWIQRQKQKQRREHQQYQQNRRVAQMMKARRQQQEKQYQRQMQYQYRVAQKQEYEEKIRRQAEEQKKRKRKMQEEKKKQDFNDFARQQYFQNLQIRRKAEQRAKRQHNSYYSQPPKQEPSQVQNFHYQNNRPSSKQQGRPSSRDRKSNYSDLYKGKDNAKQPSQQQLQNAYLNPNFHKKRHTEQKKKSSDSRPRSQRGKRQQYHDEQTQAKKIQSKKKIEQAREQMRKDRQKYMRKGMQNQKQIQTEQTQDIKQKTKVAKWGRNKSRNNSSEEKQTPAHEQSPRFKSPQEVRNGEPASRKQKGFQTLVDDSQNLFLQPHNPAQFEKYINELQDILDGVHKKIELLPELPVQQQVLFREDDELQFSLTAQPEGLNPNKQESVDTEDCDLEIFSNFSKLENVRIQLEQAFGLQNFIRLYRYIQKQIAEHGLQNFNIMQAVQEAGGDIDRKVLTKNVTLLLTLVSMEQNMCQ